jgi:polyisoprenoid-binding protein YceI
MRYALATSLILLATPAYAAHWTVDEAASSITFTGKQAGQPFTGTFKQFTPVIDFDPAHPEAGKITVTVGMASASIDDKEQNDALPTEDWFFTKQFPQAVFQSTAIRHLGSDKTGIEAYEATGTLTIRGIGKTIALPFTLSAADAATRADGEIVLNRSDFGLGGKQWKDDKWIAYPVTVHYTVIATPQK